MADLCDGNFPVSLQAEMPCLNHCSSYYKPRPSTEWDFQLNRLTGITYTNILILVTGALPPGCRPPMASMESQNTASAHMQSMSIQAVYPRQNTSFISGITVTQKHTAA